MGNGGHGAVDPTRIRALLLDADGNLFPSEPPAFAASTDVVNAMLAEVGSEVRYDAAALQSRALGRNFRSLAPDLATEVGAVLDAQELERWVAREKREVTQHLASVLGPDREVGLAVQRLREWFLLGVVSSSALSRVEACLDATGLADAVPPDRRFSAEDSLATPTSKPHPAIYLEAVRRLGLEPGEALAVEDSVAGVASAVAAGVPVVGNLAFTPDGERPARDEELRTAGAVTVVPDWDALVTLLAPASPAGTS
jgi:beta-phosphoglucomutase-like phosphatase (HAD superfamily)